MHCSTDYNLGNIYYYKNYRKLKIIKKFAFAIGFFLTIFLCNCYAFDDGDFQYWNSESISVKLKKNWKIELGEEFRFGDVAGNFYYQHSDLGLTYSGLFKWLDIGVNYQLVFEEKNDDWQYENRPHLNAALKYEINGFKLSDRNRFEYRNKEKSEDGWRYRNKFTIKFPLKLTHFEIQPYVADEIFIDFNEETFNKNRLYGGLNFKIFKNLKIEIYYLWQNNEKNDKWTDINVLGTKLRLAF